MSDKLGGSDEPAMPELVEEETNVTGDSQDEDELEDWVADDADPEDNYSAKCVACDYTADQVKAVVQHIAKTHGFDLMAFVAASTTDEAEKMYNHIKLVNYLRSLGAQDKITVTGEAWKSAEYLAPRLEEDALLFILGEDEEDAARPEPEAPFHLPGQSAPAPIATLHDLSREELEKKLSEALALQQLSNSKLAALEFQLASLQKFNKTLLDEPVGRKRAGSVDSNSSDDADSAVKEIDSGYFGSYAGFHIHEDMLKDRVRTEAYRDFIEGNPELFKDKIVMDVGCGTSILSMFAIRAGAKHVIAIDNSGIIERAKEIAKENGYESRITFIKNKAEHIEELAGVCNKVDIIISEWMGYCLLFESMLPSVLFVRDKWLAPGTGRVYPDIASLHLVGMAAPAYRKSKVDFWRKDVYGFTMQSIAKRVHFEPGVDDMQAHEVVTDSHKFFEIDCNVVKAEQLDFEAPFTLTVAKDTTLDAFVTYFDIGFLRDASKPITFTTSPSATETHWRQTVLILESPIAATKGTVISGRIQLKANRMSFRDLDIRLSFQVGSDAPKEQFFSIC